MIERKNIAKYQISMSIVLKMFKEGIVTLDEFIEIEKAIANRYEIKEGSIFRVEMMLKNIDD